jgi:glycosyltransferase involved in cell wall biosynthesis
MREFQRMRIGVDGRPFMLRATGVRRYATELCRHLDRLIPDAAFFVYSPRWIARIDSSRAARTLNRGMWLALLAGRMCRRDRLDVFWGVVTLLPILGRRVKAVSTVHDLNHMIVPFTMAASDLWGRRLLYRPALARANEIVTNSRGTADRMRAAYGRIATAIVRPGVSPEFAPQPRAVVDACLEKYGLKRPYLLAVGTRQPRKNFEALVETFMQMKSEGLLPAHSLAMAGSRGWKDDRLRALIERGISAGVVVLDYVDQDDLPALYTGADAMVFPSLYEGFGMPVLEARACGTTVVTTDIPELREAGGDDAVYIAPTPAGIHEGIRAALEGGFRPRPRREALPSWEAGAAALARVFTGEGGVDARGELAIASQTRA